MFTEDDVSAFECPISCEIPVDPTSWRGRIYSRKSLYTWFSTYMLRNHNNRGMYKQSSLNSFNMVACPVSTSVVRLSSSGGDEEILHLSKQISTVFETIYYRMDNAPAQWSSFSEFVQGRDMFLKGCPFQLTGTQSRLVGDAILSGIISVNETQKTRWRTAAEVYAHGADVCKDKHCALMLALYYMTAEETYEKGRLLLSVGCPYSPAKYVSAMVRLSKLHEKMEVYNSVSFYRKRRRHDSGNSSLETKEKIQKVHIQIRRQRKICKTFKISYISNVHSLMPFNKVSDLLDFKTCRFGDMKILC